MKILVIGDECKDIFQYGTCDRICPEAPVPVFKPTRTKFSYGMAYNVKMNLDALGADCDIISSKTNPTKTRYIDEITNQMLLRVDINDEVENIINKDLLAIDYGKYDAIVISDYDKGFLTEDDIEHIANNNPLTFLDTKKLIGDWAKNICFIKINKKEYDNNSSYLDLNYDNNLIITLGNNGAKHQDIFFPIENNHPILDLSGAGDTFLAGFVADYLINVDISSAINFANKCASWVVTQKGVVIVDLEKINENW